uniref:Uncharacterized protein n=1 Tax=Arundo donax TaxID=35708 RepID=A0A0A8XR64_ARUDO
MQPSTGYAFHKSRTTQIIISGQLVCRPNIPNEYRRPICFSDGKTLEDSQLWPCILVVSLIQLFWEN